MHEQIKKRILVETVRRLNHRLPKFMCSLLGTNKGEAEVTVAAAAAASTIAPSQAEATPFSALFSALESRFYKPDFQAIRIVLGTIKAHSHFV
jgi:hypothetical protein